MISQLMSGSRLPVGSSAMIEAGVVDEGPGDRRPLLLAARQLARELLAPGRSGRRARGSGRRPARSGRRGVPVTSRAKATFSQTDLGGQELEVLEDGPDLAADMGHAPAGQPGEVLAVEEDLAARRQLVADDELHEGRLAGPVWPTRNTKSPSGMTRSTSAAPSAVGVALGDVVQDEDRAIGSRLVAAAAGAAVARTSAQAASGVAGEGQDRLRGRATAAWPPARVHRRLRPGATSRRLATRSEGWANALRRSPGEIGT